MYYPIKLSTVVVIFISIFSFFCPIPAPPPRCRQCPTYVDVFTSHSTHPTPPPYTCTITSNHILCLCCLQPMPDRRSDSDVTIPPQKCIYDHNIYRTTLSSRNYYC